MAARKATKTSRKQSTKARKGAKGAAKRPKASPGKAKAPKKKKALLSAKKAKPKKVARVKAAPKKAKKPAPKKAPKAKKATRPKKAAPKKAARPKKAAPKRAAKKPAARKPAKAAKRPAAKKPAKAAKRPAAKKAAKKLAPRKPEKKAEKKLEKKLEKKAEKKLEKKLAPAKVGKKPEAAPAKVAPAPAKPAPASAKAAPAPTKSAGKAAPVAAKSAAGKGAPPPAKSAPTKGAPPPAKSAPAPAKSASGKGGSAKPVPPPAKGSGPRAPSKPPPRLRASSPPPRHVPAIVALPIPMLPASKRLTLEERYALVEKRLEAQTEEFRKRYYDSMDMSWIHHDSALEGVVYTLEELRAGLSGQVASLADSSLQPVAEEIRRHKEAIEFVRDFGTKKRLPVTLDVLKKIYLILHPEEGDLKTVKYRKDIPQHRLYFHEYAPPDKIAYKVRQVVDWLNDPETKKTRGGVRVAARAHYDLLRVYPFATDSGKVARLFMNLILMRSGLPPAIIHSTERQRYYEALKGSAVTVLQMVQEAVDNSLASVEKLLDDHEARARHS